MNPFDIAYTDEASPEGNYQFANPSPESSANPFDVAELQDLSQTVKTPEDKARFDRVVAARLGPKLPVRSASEDVLPAIGKGLNRAGQFVVGGLADLGSLYAGQSDPFTFTETGEAVPRPHEQTNLEAWRARESLPAVEQMKFLPTPARVVGRASQGLIETVPKLALVAGAEAVGIPPPVAAGAVFGTTEEGFSTKDAFIAAALPFVGKYGGQLAELVAKKSGIPSDAALHFINGAGSTTAAAAYLATIQASEIANLPPEQRKDAIIEGVAGLVGQAMLGPMGMKRLPQTPAEMAGRYLFSETAARDASRERAIADSVAQDVARPVQLDWQGQGEMPPRPGTVSVGTPPLDYQRPAAYQFGTETETRNLSESRPTPSTEAPPVTPEPVIARERIVITSESTNADVQRAAQRIYLGQGGVELYGAEGARVPLPDYRRRKEMGLPLDKKFIVAQLDLIRKGKPQNARSIPSPTQIPQREVRPQVGESSPLRQPGETPAAPEVAQKEAQTPVEPVKPPSTEKPSETVTATENKPHAPSPPVTPVVETKPEPPPEEKPKGFLAQKFAAKKPEVPAPAVINRAAAETGETMPVVPQTDDPKRQFGANLLETLRAIKRDPTISQKRKDAIIYAARWWVGQHPDLQEFRGAVGGEMDARGLRRPASVPGIWPELMRADITQIPPEAWQQLRDTLKAIWFRQSESGVAPGERAITRDSLFDALLPFNRTLARAGVQAPDISPQTIGIRPKPDLAKQLRMPTTDELRDVINSIPEESRPLAWMMALHPTRINEFAPDTSVSADNPRGLGLKVKALHLDDPTGPWMDLTGKRSKVYGKDVEVPITAELAQYLRDYIARKNLGPEDELIPRSVFNQSVRKRFHDAVRAAVEKHKLLKSLAGVRKEDAAEAVTAAVFRKFAVTRLLREADLGKSGGVTVPLVELMSGDVEATLRKKYGIKPSRREFARQLTGKGKQEAEKPLYPGYNPTPERGVRTRKPSKGDAETRGERGFDVIDAAKNFANKISWKLIKEANPDWEPVGAAREVFAAEGEPADTAARALAESGHYKGDPDHVDEFGEAMNAAARARTGNAAQKRKEGNLLDEEEKRRLRFEADLAKPSKNTEPLDLNTINEGDKFKYRGQEFKVAKLHFDPSDDGRVSGIELDDGEVYGTLHISDAETLSKLQRDKTERAKPESVEEQKARLANEAAVRKEKEAKDKLAEEAAAPKKGNAGDIGQGDLLNPPQDLWSPPQPKPSIVDQAISAIEEAQRKLREGGEKGNLGMALPKAVLDVALEAMRLSLKAGKGVAEAIDAGLAAIRGRMGKTPWNESRTRAQLQRIVEAKERLESDDMVEARQRYSQVMGIRNAGERYGQESITAIQKKLRQWEQGPEGEGQSRRPGPYNFGPEVPVTPDNTARAFQTIANLIDLPTAESELLRIRDVAPEQMAPGILLSDIFRYAVRSMMGKKGDPSLVYHIAENYDRINTSTGPVGPRGLGRALRALREGADDPTLVNLLELFDAMEAAASVKLYGKKKLEKIAEIAREVQDGVPQQMKKPEVTEAVERKVRASGLTPELAWMRQFTDQLQQRYIEWLKPDSIVRKSLLSQIKLMIKEWEKRNIGPGGDAKFTQELGGQLYIKAVESIEAENARREERNEEIKAYNEEHPDKPKDLLELIKLTPELQRALQREVTDLAREIWVRKQDAQADVNKREAQVYVEKALDNWGREQTDWLKSEKIKTEAQREYESFMDRSAFASDWSEPLTEANRAEEVAKLARAIAKAGVLERTALDFADAAFTRKLRFDENVRLKAKEQAAKQIYNDSEGAARQWIAKMQTMRIPMTDANKVRAAIIRAMRLLPARDEVADLGKVGAMKHVDPVSSENHSQSLVDELVALGVPDDFAVQVARQVQQDRLFRWNTARVQAMKNAAKSRSVSGLIEELLAAPVLMQKSPQWRADVSRRWFESAGLSREDAEAASKIFTDEFDAQLEEAGKQLAERIGRRENFTGERFADFVSAVRAGMLDPSKPWAMKFAEKKGIRIPSPEEMQKLAELDAKLEDARVHGDERDVAEISSEMMSVYSKMHLPPEKLKVVAANVVATQLLGLRTLIVQGSPLVFTALDRVFATMATPHRIKEIWNPVFTAMNGVLSEIGLATSKDAYTFVRNELTSGSNILRRVWETGLDDVRSGNKARQALGILKVIYGSQQYFLRVLNAMDQASGIMVRESQLVLYGSDVLRQAGFTTSQIGDWVAATKKLKQAAYLAAIERGESKMRAKVHADSLGAEMIRVHLQEKLVEHGIDPSAAATQANEAWKGAENDAYSVIGRLGEGVKETEEGGPLSRAPLLGLHTLLKWSSAMRRGEANDRILAVTLLGYVNVPIRTARFFAWNSPYGLMRMAIHHGRRRHYEKQGIDYYGSEHNLWKQSLANEYQARYRMKNALAATAAQAALTAAGIAYFGQSSNQEDIKKDNQIFVTGDGPRNKEMRDAWLKAGFRQNSVVMFVGGKPATLPLTRLGEPLAHLFWIMSARDDYNWRKKEKLATGHPFKETWSATIGYALGNYAALLGQRGPLSSISRWAKATGTEGGSQMLLASGLSSVAAAGTMPYLGAQRTIRDIAMGKVDTSSITSAIMANFPVLGAFQNRAINRFGDPLGNRQWSAIVGDASGTLTFQVEDNAVNRKLYQTLAEKGVAPPALRRGVLEEKYGQMSDEEFGKFAQRSGDMLKKATLSNLSVISKQSPEDAKKTLARLSSTSDNIAAKGLGLESVRPAQAGIAGITLPAASGSSGGLLGGTAGLLAGGTRASGGILAAGAGRSSVRGGRLHRTRRLSAGGRLRTVRARRLSAGLRRPRTLRVGNRRLTAGLRRPSMRLRRLALG